MLSRTYKLEHITSAAQRVKLSTLSALSRAGKEPSVEVPPTPIHVPHLSLPIPEDIASLLLRKRCPVAAAKSLSDAYLRSAHQIRDMYQSSYSQTYTRLSRSLTIDSPHFVTQLQKLGSFLEQQYRDKIMAAERLALDQVEASQKSTPTIQTAKTVFNQEFVPLLEKYFEYNAYPSAPDRAALARKSMMTPRQIEVWFQNHRNRAKKEGKRLKKLTLDPLPLKLSLESLEKKMPFFIIPEVERVDPTRTFSIKPDSEDDSDDEGLASSTTTPLRETSSFSENAPQHAFPMTYPPTCDYDPFPVKTGQFPFPEPVWARRPATTRRQKVALDLEDFILDFSMKLVIREPASRKQKRKSGTSNAPWYAATHTIAPSAPHPALVRAPCPNRALPTLAPPLPTVAAPSSRLRPFRSPSPMSHPASFVSVARTFPQSPARRKVARLPKRAPQHASLSHRGISPAASDSSPSPSPSFGSRTSSFNSDTSDRRPSSSSSSSSSSSTPTTPVLSATSLPESIHSPSVSVSGLDFPHDDDLFGDSLDDYSHLNRLRGLDKQSFNFDPLTPPSAAHHVVP